MGQFPQVDRTGMERLARIAAALRRTAARRNPGWPGLWLFTDPDRTPDVPAAVMRMPPGSGVVLRTFGRPDSEASAPMLRRLTRERGMTLLIGVDAELAARCGADGVHLPERLIGELARLRAGRPRWRLTVAAHSARALVCAAAFGADAAFLSPVLPSTSASAGAPLGATKVAALTRKVGLPVYGLGGVDAATAHRLRRSGLAGLAGVGFAARPPRT